MSDHEDAIRQANHTAESQINEAAARKGDALDSHPLAHAAASCLCEHGPAHMARELQRAEQALEKAYNRISLVLDLCKNERNRKLHVADIALVENIEELLTRSPIPATCPNCSGALPPECGPDCPTCQVDIARYIHETQVLQDAPKG